MTQTLTTERQQFEEWFNEEIVLHISASNETVVRLMWKAWQASRELLANREAQPVEVRRSLFTKISNRPADEGGNIFYCVASGEMDLLEAILTAPPAPAVPRVSVIPEAATLTNINQLCPLDKDLSQTDFATGWNDCRQYALTHDGLPPVIKGIHAAAQGWNACRAAMLAQPVSQGYKLPEGFKLMPLEMTDEIGEAIAMEASCCGGIALCIYEAALAAAPEGNQDEIPKR